MCGIAGGTMYDSVTIREAMRQMTHRGTDASKWVHYSDIGLWLGHNRLAIQDLNSSADQPFEGPGFTLVFNGELWRSNMDEYGYTSDTKLLADLYSELGDDLVEFTRRLDGMFAFVIYDYCRRRVVVARDRMGRIPLYVVSGKSGMAFASEAKAITLPLGVPFLGNNSRTGGGVKLFPPGVVAVYPLDRSAPLFTKFASLDDVGITEVDANDLGADHYAEGIRSLLVSAVANESIADVPVCTILSGGIDSTIITAILAKSIPDLRAYTVSVGQSNGKDDLFYARRAAKALGVKLTEVIVDPDDVVQGLEEAVWAVEDARWVQVAPAVPQIAMARQIGADGYKVVFGGEGSDELFGSYADVRRWAWKPQQYYDRRLQLCGQLHNNNLIRGNKAMMWGGTVELRTPFLDRRVVDYCLRIPTRYRSNNDGKGSVMKPLLREAFRGWVPDDLLMRKKVTFQEGAHSDFLKGHKDCIKEMFSDLFG